MEEATREDLERTKRLARLVDQFLEEEITKEELIKAPERIRSLAQCLNENLWGGELPPYLGDDWVFQSDEGDAEFDNPDMCSATELHDAMISAGADTIMFYHDLLKKGFWEQFKMALVRTWDTLAQRERTSFSNESNPLAVEWGMEQEYIDTIYRENMEKIMVNQSIEVRCVLENGVIQFYHHKIDAIREIIKLIKGLPLNIFGKCRDISCKRWFVRTTKHKRDFCTKRCGARHNQRIKRESDRDAHNRYQRELYRKKVMGT